ncbi:hypothetical protein LINPERPRIM_LOCUS18046 [Linum perenne]
MSLFSNFLSVIFLGLFCFGMFALLESTRNIFSPRVGVVSSYVYGNCGGSLPSNWIVDLNIKTISTVPYEIDRVESSILRMSNNDSLLIATTREYRSRGGIIHNELYIGINMTSLLSAKYEGDRAELSDIGFLVLVWVRTLPYRYVGGRRSYFGRFSCYPNWVRDISVEPRIPRECDVQVTRVKKVMDSNWIRLHMDKQT